MPGPETCDPPRGGPAADADEARPAGDAPASFAALLAGCRSLFPRALMGDAGWERILDRARRLPRSVADTHFGFEFHLAETRPEADLCVVASPGSDLSQHYIREGERARDRGCRGARRSSGGRARKQAQPSQWAQESGRAGPAAALAAGLREQIANPDSWLARCVEGLVLEYDLAGLPPHRPPAPPGVFLAPKKSADPKILPAHRDPAGVLAALAATVGWDGHEHEEMQGAVERVFAALPESGRVFQVGALPARSPKAFRLVLAGVPKAEVLSLLERLEWPGPMAAAADVIASTDDVVAYLFLSMDVNARGPGSRLGLELYRPSRWQEAKRAEWRPLIARLEERGWCLPSKAEGLRRWPGVEWLVGREGMHRIRQGINHVKVVVDRRAPTVAKAYAGMSIRPCVPEGGTPSKGGRHGRRSEGGR